MLLCGKCNKKIESTTSAMCVVKHSYEVIAYCHGSAEKKTLSLQALRDAEEPGNDIYFFAPAASEPKKLDATVGPEKFGRGKRARGEKGSGL